MSRRPKVGLFITGTNTEVGKTYVASLIAAALFRQGHRVGVYKPIASGCRCEGDQVIADDAVQLWQAAGRPLDLDDVCPQRFSKPVAPHLAARAEGARADFGQMVSGIAAWGDFDIVVVEGAGGLMSPVSDDHYSADLALEFGFPTIIVAANRLGVINEVLQTEMTAVNYGGGLLLGGTILNDSTERPDDASRTDNLAELRKRCRRPVLDHVPFKSGRMRDEPNWFKIANIRSR